jgi:hypothetical protein
MINEISEYGGKRKGDPMARKKSEKGIPLLILIIGYGVLLYAIYSSLSTLVLAVLGDSVMGTVDRCSTHLNDRKSERGRSRVVYKGYWFTVDGREYRGFVVYSSDEAHPTLKDGQTRSERIRYIPVFPYINKPAMLSEFGEMGEGAIIYHLLSSIGCLILLRLVARSTGRGKKKKKQAVKKPAKMAAEPAPPPETWNDTANMFCPNCGNKLTEGAAFCSGCGAETQASTPGVCAACGAALPEGAEFCIGCGTPLNRAAP